MINPHFTYVFAFMLALVVYPLGWSSLYPALSLPTATFIIATIVAHLIAGAVFRSKVNIRASPAPPLDLRVGVYLTVCLYIFWTAEFVHGGGIPFVEILLRRPYDYKVFGIPHLHVFIVTFSSFVTVLLFHRYVASGSRAFLMLCAVNLLAAILIYNRGMFLFNLAGCAFLYLIYQAITTRQIVVVTVSSLILMFLFGMMGSMRVSNESRVKYTNEGFLGSGGATVSFRQSSIPAEYFWTYVYTTSPLANLQVNINASDRKPISTTEVLNWVNNEVLPDFISKRVNRFSGIEQAKIKTIPGPFNATTLYAGSFSRLGWLGVFLMAVITLVTPWVYAKMVSVQSPFFLSGLVIMNTIYLFMIFENTLRFTGFSLQLAYPLLMSIGVIRRRWIPGFLVR